MRPFHDLRHSSLTNGAAAGEGSIALMTRAGHASMVTTKQYLHLAGTVFRDEAAALERRRIHWPMGRLAKPREVVNGALFLASDESSYVNGTSFLVDGGLTAAYVTPE